MMHRRKLLSMAVFGAATAGATALLRSPESLAATKSSMLLDPRYSPRGVDGMHARLGTLDVDSRQDFTKGFGVMQRRQVRAAADRALDRVLEREGIDPTQDMDMATLLKLVENEPAITISPQTWLANQRLTWKNLQDYFHANADAYLSEMEAADKSGPGSLELSPGMFIPEHASHQIHIQPGGYVGDPFAGHMYQYATNSFWFAVRGHNEQDQIHRAAVAKLPMPTDRKVKRILDYGCGIGQFTLALKERFPDAEVWGLDIGGPMVRYSHMRAAHLGFDVNFVQRLAEDNGFPDGYFDLVTSFIAHHEMPAEVSRQVVAEVQRVSRPGAVYYPVDFKNGGERMMPRMLFGRWWDHRWNNEPWSLQFSAMNFDKDIQDRGFYQVANAEAAVRGFGVRHFIRA